MLARLAYVALWTLAAGFWSLAAAAGANRSPLAALPYGLLQMGIAGALGVGVIWLTRRVPLGESRITFVAVHLLALAGYAGVYATGFVWPDLVAGDLAHALAELGGSPIVPWNLLMGSWLYLVIAGLTYAAGAHRRATAAAAEAAEARVLAHQAQLAALRAQLNPHFLFNTLHTVASLVQVDVAAADAALERLGDLLRYALAEEEEVSLASEWAFTGDYLALERLRLGARLHIVSDVDPRALAVLVPVLLLQPIVENAVRHAIDPRPAGGRLELSADVDGERLVLRVADDGPGVAPDAMARAGVGLEPLARRRLRALVGDRDWLVCAGEAADGPEALRTIDALRPDLAFLDIHLPGLSGIELLARVRHVPAVIFTTAHDRYAVTAFELAAVDYLLKPFGAQRFGRAMERVRPLLEQRAAAPPPPCETPPRRLFVREGGRVVPLPTAAIERLEACDDFVEVHAQGRRYRINVPLQELEGQLDASCFVRVHRSHIVNLDHVVGWEPFDGSRFEVRLRDGTRITASRQRSRVLRHVAR